MNKWNTRPEPDFGINRRTLLKSAAALGGMGAASLIGVKSAFGQTATPKRGGHFILGVGAGAASDSLDPITWTTNFTETLGKTLHGYLTQVKPDGTLSGELAESWEVSPDAKTWTFKLRQGAEFHNGKPVTATDVIASINYHRGDKSKSPVKDMLSSIEEIRDDGNGSLIVSLREGNADFVYLLEDFHLPILPSKDGSVDLSGVGAGGYVLGSFNPGISASGTRFANYWKSDAAWFDSFELVAIHDVTARTNALITGQIHAMDRCDLKTVHLLERAGNIEVLSIPGTQYYTITTDCASGPFVDPNVRLAAKYAIDRQQILDTLLRGYGQIGNDQPIGATNRYFAKDLPQRAYDPDKARFHLNKAGLSELKVGLSAADAAFAGSVDVAVLYQETAAKAGITIDVVREADDSYWDAVWLKKPFYMGYWLGRPTADWIFSIGYAAEAPWNSAHWKNPRFNELLVSARAELDDAKRLGMYTEMQTICRDDGGEIIPVFVNNVNAISSGIGHGTIGTNWDIDGFRCIERWWFKA